MDSDECKHDVATYSDGTLRLNALDEEDDNDLADREEQLEEKIAGIDELILLLALRSHGWWCRIYLLECQEVIFTQGRDMSP